MIQKPDKFPYAFCPNCLRKVISDSKGIPLPHLSRSGRTWCQNFFIYSLILEKLEKEKKNDSANR